FMHFVFLLVLRGTGSGYGAESTCRCNGVDGYCHGSPIFKGGYDPDGAQSWIEGIERIFGAMRCLDEHK
ncbi:hypothetical protein A2U01_0100011, partial [Trifolium medium]|nr:hypothetical protein [Trifolium medium]